MTLILNQLFSPHTHKAEKKEYARIIIINSKIKFLLLIKKYNKNNYFNYIFNKILITILC